MSQKSEIKQTVKDVELLGVRLDTMLRELAMQVRGNHQQLATRIDEARHQIKGALTTPVNAVSLIEIRNRATEEVKS